MWLDVSRFKTTKKIGASRCIGIDLEDAPTENYEGIEYQKANIDGENLKIPTDSADLIMMNNVIEHLYHPNKLLDECNRVLKPEGHLMIFTPNHANLKNRMRLLFGLSVNYPIERWYRDDPHIVKNGDKVFAGHIREYCPYELQEIMNYAGFEIRKKKIFPVVRGSPQERLSGNKLMFRLYQTVEEMFPFLGYMIFILAQKRDNL